MNLKVLKLFSNEIFVQALVKWIFMGRDYAESTQHRIEITPDFLEALKEPYPNTHEALKRLFADVSWVAIHRYNNNLKFSFNAERKAPSTENLTILTKRVDFIIDKDLNVQVAR